MLCLGTSGESIHNGWNVRYFPLDGLVMGGAWVISIEPVGLGPTVIKKLGGLGVCRSVMGCMLKMYV